MRREIDGRSAIGAFFDSYYRLRPVNATFTGVHEYDHLLPDWSRAGVEAAVAEMRELRARLAAEGVASLGDADVAARDWTVIDGALADSFLEIQIAELGGRHFQRGNPSLAVGEAAFAIVSLMIRDFAPVAERARAAVARLRALPRFLAEALDVVGEEPVPTAWVEKGLKEFAGLRALLSDGIDRWRSLEGIPGEVREALRDSADVALGGVESSAGELQRMRSSGAPVKACGRELLELLVRRGHWSERGVDELRREAQDQFALERARLDEMAKKVAPGGLAEVQERLSELHPAATEYYRSFAEVWEACRARAVSLDLVTWPDFPIRYVPIPEWTRSAAPSLYYLYYRSPAPLDESQLHDYVVTPIEGLDREARTRHLRAWNDSVIKLNHVVHHGALGHHVQNWYAARAPSQIGQVGAVDCASRIGMFLGGTTAEGWACYATDLMDAAGFLTPEEQVSEQQTRVRMLARAIVDIELHSGHRSFEDCVALYTNQVGMPAPAAHAETVKNSMFPGTALMYWLGTSAIHALRATLARRKGTSFGLKAFHDEFLSFGSIPVAVAARLMGSS